ncbi:alpha/beta fold hydrolase [Melissococcus plutonius]|uniref:Carboxylesterase n=1 Tax=Melissococcus plutonius TaxID=33970 RepID=A0A2Z5Y1E0_9ENTE|nr:alpha/beta fold hydrolase [Melissococcus plutonius]BAL61744.1 carboxylesterase [Melissococcus plutonius DAT561]MCV2498309.1 alpha/beta fold hydrolase [Melissococcus plutonius]MCV2500826.1 alpha/beta fold hydrolase [Melissococcus plutonius]MCV2504580.1 alpha/beta fold hydrolase [Melissococcus plutonius]MCV2506924.1 alpha/beta fold hydrolase [Melissococcus plutonius]
MNRTKQLPKSLFTENGSRSVLLLHAYSGSSNDVRLLSRFLEKEGYTVYAPNFSGHGTLIPEDILNRSPEDWRQETLDAIQFLYNKGYEQIAILGLSMGGLFAMDALTKNIDSLIGGGSFCSPIYPCENHVPENFMLYAEQLLIKHNLSTSEIQYRLAEIKPRMLEQLKWLESFSKKITDQLSEITRPVFIAQSGCDQMIDRNSSFHTIKKLTQIPFTLQWYPDSGHVITTGPEHKKLEKDVLHFLTTLSWN